jgi:hypothetical protein
LTTPARINLVKEIFKPGSHTIFSYAPFLPTSVAFKEASSSYSSYLLVSTKGKAVICFIFTPMLYYSTVEYIEQSPSFNMVKQPVNLSLGFSISLRFCSGFIL